MDPGYAVSQAVASWHCLKFVAMFDKFCTKGAD